MVGTIANGILSPTFGAHLTAQLEAREVTAARDWQLTWLGGTPKPRHLDIDLMSLGCSPMVGGSSFDIERFDGPYQQCA